MRIRFMTFNTWHGLDPYHPKLMLPLESLGALWTRYRIQAEALAETIDPKTDFVLLQELNPWQLRLRHLARCTGLKGHGTGVNQGLRVGLVGYPLLLDEGLGILSPPAARQSESFSLRLSGRAIQPRLPGGFPVSVQLAEVRGAMAVRCELAEGGERLRLLVANVHLHAGSGGRADLDRRSAEVSRLLEWLEPLAERADLAIVGGDFNCEPGAPELEPLLRAGFSRAGESQPTWSPRENPLCAFSAKAAPEGTEHRRWDEGEHALDQLYYRVHPARGATLECSVATERVFDTAPFVSDHFGLRCEARLRFT